LRINSHMQQHDYETANTRYTYCCRVRGTLKDYIHAQSWAVNAFGRGSWTSTWTEDSRDYSDDQARDWLFLFKDRDKYLMFMLAWHNAQL